MHGLKVTLQKINQTDNTECCHSVRLGSKLTRGCFVKDSRWFKRGWTLQELIAPKEVILYSSSWKEIGNRDFWRAEISDATKIHDLALLGGASDMKRFSIAQKMSWAASRMTTREEDIAYCLLGIFGVQMPLLYGEGKKAFNRLQEEVMKDSDDQSIFAWESRGGKPGRELMSLLASSPDLFRNANVVPYRSWRSSEPYSMTNAGLQLTGFLGSGNPYRTPDLDNVSILRLPVYSLDHPEMVVGIHLLRLSAGSDQYARTKSVLFKSSDAGVKHWSQWKTKKIYVRKEIALPSLHEQKETGKSMSFNLFMMSDDTARVSFGIAHIHPVAQWIVNDGKHTIRPPTFDGKVENIDNWSWQVSIALWIFIDWDQQPRQAGADVPLISISEHSQHSLLLGYDGRSDCCWCALREPEDTTLPTDLPSATSWNEYAGSTTRSFSSLRIHNKVSKGQVDKLHRFLAIDVSLHLDEGVSISSEVSPVWDRRPIRVNIKSRFEAEPMTKANRSRTMPQARSPDSLVVLRSHPVDENGPHVASRDAGGSDYNYRNVPAASS